MLLRLAYLGVTNAFAVLRLLPMSDRDKDVEILALRHQIAVLERHLGRQRARFEASGNSLGSVNGTTQFHSADVQVDGFTATVPCGSTVRATFTVQGSGPWGTRPVVEAPVIC
ncbi:hypothetical protein AB0O82_29845 [Kitasatospora sp. NPDC088264]|uniref:hypothetical protein n=1 Tax=Kitasatospora sp. NPDC088264 TaxID=3155296 RepID=UPI00342E9B38